MKKIGIAALILLLFYTRFVNLGWGLPYPLHPDERNMAVAVQQLSCPNYALRTTNYELRNCLNPHFFAYGQLPLYLAYGEVQLFHLATGQAGQPSYNEATIALRLLSALSSLLLVFVLLKIIEVLIPKRTLSAFSFKLLAFSFLIFQPYMIQFSHFGTTESLLMLLYSLTIYYSLRLHLAFSFQLSAKYLLLAAVFSGLALGTKTSSILFLGVPLITIVIRELAGGRIEGARQKAQNINPNGHIDVLVRWREAFNSDGICQRFIKLMFSLFLYLFISSFFFIISSPQSFLHWPDFISSMNYESAVGLGVYVPFYTRQFMGTAPILFQFQHILPYVLGWPQLIMSILGFVFLPSNGREVLKSIWILILLVMQKIIVLVERCVDLCLRRSVRAMKGKVAKQKNTLSELPEEHKDIHRGTNGLFYDILRIALLLSFLPPSFFFAKWTRFIAPSFPLFSLFAILFLLHYAKKLHINIKVIIFITVITVIPGLSFLSVYTSPDVRFAASDWIYKNIPAESRILSETANVIDIPVPTIPYSLTPIPSYQINSFNFYDLDENPELQSELFEALSNTDYIIVPSRRIFKNHSPYSLSPNPYPLLNKYYSDLFSGASGFEQVAEFSSFPRIELSILGSTFRVPFSDEGAEETWTVFDHPVIRIYKRRQKIEDRRQNQTQQKKILDFSDYKTIPYTLLPTPYTLLVADTPEKWEQGLMYVKNREDIGGLDGMMFTFPDSQKRTFWNKNTLSHLTLYWINKGKVIGVSDLPSITETKEVYAISSPSNADTVVELLQ